MRGIVGIIVLLFIICCWFIPDLGNYAITFLVPPRIYYVIGFVVIVILYKILIELRNRNNKDDGK